MTGKIRERTNMKTDTIDFADGSKTVYYYDDSDLEVRVEDVGPDGKLIMAVEKNYNETGICTGWEVNDGKGSLLKRFELSFDDQGNEIETRQYDNRGNLEHVLPPHLV